MSLTLPTPQPLPKFKWGLSHGSGHMPASVLSLQNEYAHPPLSHGYKAKRDHVLCPLQVWEPIHRPTTSDAGKAPTSPPGLPGCPWPLQASYRCSPGGRGAARRPGTPGPPPRWRGHRGDPGHHLPGLLRGQMRGPLKLEPGWVDTQSLETPGNSSGQARFSFPWGRP